MSESINVIKRQQHKQKTTTGAEKTKTASSHNQGTQASKKEPVQKKSTLEMMHKDWKKTAAE